jgi:hypothetical protein
MMPKDKPMFALAIAGQRQLGGNRQHAGAVDR